MTEFEQVHHKDDNGLNNTRENLAVLLPSDNIQAQGPRKHRGSSQYKGVFKPTKSKKWQASIQVGKGKKYLGFFSDEKDAALARDAAVRELHGSYAYLNFLTPDEVESEKTR